MTYDNRFGTPSGPPAPAGQTLAPWVVPPAQAPGAPATNAHWAAVSEPPAPGGGGGGRWITVAAAVVCLVLVGVGLAWFFTREPAISEAGSSSSASPSSGADGGVAADGPAGAPLQPTSVTATCQAADGEDSAGATITYDPEHTIDGRPDTAWRCDGSAVGARLVLTFDRQVTVTSVALVPGYAKVDPASGENRFTQNHTVTAATWMFDDGTTHIQQIQSPQPAMTGSDLTGGVPTTRVVLQITATGNPTAERDFTAISDVQISGF